MFSFGKFLAGGIFSALLGIVGVWFVVAQSMQGLQTAIDATNANIANVQNSVAKQIELEFKLIRNELRSEFDKTRDTIQKASFVEPEFDGLNGGKYRIALNRGSLPLSVLVENNAAAKAWFAQVGLEPKAGLADSFIFAVAGSPETIGMWESANDARLDSYKQVFGSGLKSPRVMADLGCLESRFKNDGSIVFVPKAQKTLAGSDGIVCFVDDLDNAAIKIKQ